MAFSFRFSSLRNFTNFLCVITIFLPPRRVGNFRCFIKNIRLLKFIITLVLNVSTSHSYKKPNLEQFLSPTTSFLFWPWIHRNLQLKFNSKENIFKISSKFLISIYIKKSRYFSCRVFSRLAKQIWLIFGTQVAEMCPLDIGRVSG